MRFTGRQEDRRAEREFFLGQRFLPSSESHARFDPLGAPGGGMATESWHMEMDGIGVGVLWSARRFEVGE